MPPQALQKIQTKTPGPGSIHLRRARRFAGVLSRYSLLLACVYFHAHSAAGEVIEAHRYTEITGENHQEIQWRLEKDSEFTLTSTTANEVSVCSLDADLNTLSWQIARKDEDTTLTAERFDDEIHLSGHHAGAPIERRLKIDAAPWYQAGSISLRAFVQSAESEIRFWILRPGKFSAHKLIAVRQGKENLNINGVPISAHKIRVGLTGWKAPLWSAHYWFSAKNGVFLRYQGPSGPPGSPETVVELSTDRLSLNSNTPLTGH
jgi:hypothetical protein